MSPELLDPHQYNFEDSRSTKESDCYALGMVIYEVLSGQAPFSQFKNVTVMRKVMMGERPERPGGTEGTWFEGDLWETLNLCWEAQPGSRPSIEAILKCLGRVSRTWKPPPSPVGKDVEMDEGDWDLTVCDTLFQPVSLRAGFCVRDLDSR